MRMAHLAIVGSHAVNGVAKIHSDIVKNAVRRIRKNSLGTGKPGLTTWPDDLSHTAVQGLCGVLRRGQVPEQDQRHHAAPVRPLARPRTGRPCTRLLTRETLWRRGAGRRRGDRWLHQANPTLSAYITELLGSNHWISNLDELAGLRKFADDPAVQRQWMDIKRQNKVGRKRKRKKTRVLGGSLANGCQLAM